MPCDEATWLSRRGVLNVDMFILCVSRDANHITRRWHIIEHHIISLIRNEKPHEAVSRVLRELWASSATMLGDGAMWKLATYWRLVEHRARV